ncbi:DUF2784 domain-containing protein [Methylomarinum sp. Ch1-1]|uniref:DUF2784 domain-containing protein n=1 Tax=Methylomarinum roseum TaxID=3067653 RepID=A0AAU7NVY3_9GAMM|nr:DUF2784 domain-containing protein [Methylomarinum sp. Ch1-1]MDP4522765.1 DUF2784 domain-containing protein [Methylomarinum sp. Ch1-1]
MPYRIIADLLVVLHLGFIVFVMLGGLLLLKYRWMALLHVPAVIWGTLLEFRGWYCPLTGWENDFRQSANQAGYSGGFVEHYLIPLIYPAGLTADTQILLGILVVAVNLLIYAYLIFSIIRRARR